MCLAVPGRIVRISGQDLLRTGSVEFGGAEREISLAFVPEAEVGDYVMVHVGFGISIVDKDEALRTLQEFREIRAEAERFSR